MKKKNVNKFDIYLTGVGGLGVLTMGVIVAQAGLRQGYQVKTCETHGLAQRYGAINMHVRLGKSLKSPMIPEGQADLVISLEPLEALRAAYYASRQAKTRFLMNTEKIYPITCFVDGNSYMPVDRIARKLKGFSSKVYHINASKIVKDETGSTLAENIFMLGLASKLGLLPISRKNLIAGFTDILRKRHLELNNKVFNMGENAAKRIKSI